MERTHLCLRAVGVTATAVVAVAGGEVTGAGTLEVCAVRGRGSVLLASARLWDLTPDIALARVHRIGCRARVDCTHGRRGRRGRGW